MSVFSAIRSRRALAGSLAVAAGTAAIVTPAVAPPLAANPLDEAEVDPTVTGDTGTYESCTAMFGLTNKENAAYVTFTVEGTASPLPAIGNGLTPVLTIETIDGVEECTPEIGFSDTDSWRAYFLTGPSGPIALAGFPYPGSPGYLVPAAFVTVTSVTPAIPAPLGLSLRVETTVPGVTVTSTPTDLTFPPPDEIAAVETVANELGGPGSELGDFFILAVENGCQEPSDSQLNLDLAAALIALTGVPESLYTNVSPDACDQSTLAGEVRVAQILAEGLGQAVQVTVNTDAPGPGPRPNPTPGPTPEPVTPSFTG